MATRVEIVEEEIRKLSVAIEGLETLSKDTTDKDEKKNLRDEISQKTALMIAKQETLNLYLKSQQVGSASAGTVGSASASSAGEGVAQESPPNPRKRRWDELNECLGAKKNSKERKDGEISTPYSSVSYKQVEGVFGPLIKPYTQGVKDIPAKDFELLSQFLAKTGTSIGDIEAGNEAQRLYFISPILVVVCSLFDGQVQIKVEHELTGKNVKANGRFEFMLQRGDKCVCIVEAKKEDMEQGRAQCLIGCEVASDVDNLRTVYGIVTTFDLWTFWRSCDDKIERDRTTLLVEEGVVNPVSLMKIAGKIYAMLSDEN